MSHQSRKIIITGASQGLGLHIAETLLAEGCRITICARGEKLLGQVHQKLHHTFPQSKIASIPCNVACKEEVQKLIEHAHNQMGGIDGIVLNAGIYGPMGKTETVDLDAWISALEVNLLGVLLPCRSVIPHFRQQRFGKIVAISGGGATKALPGISAYAASKTAAIRLLECLALELIDEGIQVNAVAPGALQTRLIDQVLEAGPDKVGQDFFRQNQVWKEKGATDPKVACQLISWLLSEKCPAKLTGKLISAPWDPWSDIPSHMDALIDSDIFCLRRIIPEDRNQVW